MCKVKVSVIIPYYNRETMLLRALKSVKSQTFTDFEIILIDDGSTDKSHKIVDDFINENLHINIKNIYQRNMGPSIARNNGIKRAEGEYIAFLDSDDEWLPEKLSIQIALMEKCDIDLLGCNYYLIKNNRVNEFIFIHDKLKQITFKRLLTKHYYATPCVVVRKEVFEDVGYFPENQHYMEDSYIFTSIARKYKTYMISDFLVNIYKLPYGEDGLSSNLWEMEKYELLNIKRFRKENIKYKEKLTLVLYIGVNVFSIVKYIKRRIAVMARNA